MHMERIIGIELGSTRIKSVLVDGNAAVLATGSFEWENQLEDGLWTYSLADVEKGLQASYKALAEDYTTKYGDLAGDYAVLRDYYVTEIYQLGEHLF